MKILKFSVLLIVITLSYSQMSFSQGCEVTGATPDGGEVVVCTGTDTDGLETTNQEDDVTIEDGADISNGGGDVIKLLDGNDKVLMNGGSVFTDDTEGSCIRFEFGNNEFHMKDGSLDCGHGIEIEFDAGPSKLTIDDGIIFADDEAISTTDSADEIYVNGGELSAGGSVIQSQNGNDKVIITGGRLTQTNDSDEAVDTGGDDDHISVSHAIVDGRLALNRQAIDCGDEDDTAKLGTGAQILGLINGGADFDTLVFEMGVNPGLIDLTCAEILSKSPQSGRITINGLLYEWENFEVLRCELVPAERLPIPTLSEWGLIAMAGLIGVIGLLAIRRKKVTA